MTWSYDFPQTKHPVTYSLRCGWGCNVKFRNPSATVVIVGGLFNIVDDGSLAISQGRKMSGCPRFSGVGDSGLSGIGVFCWHN